MVIFFECSKLSKDISINKHAWRITDAYENCRAYMKYLSRIPYYNR